MNPLTKELSQAFEALRFQSSEKHSEDSLEFKLGGPFILLKPGTLRKLGGKLKKPWPAALVSGYKHSKILDSSLEEVRTIAPEKTVSTTVMYPDYSKFVGIAMDGVFICDLEGNLLHTVITLQYNRVSIRTSAFEDRVPLVVPMDEDTVLYVRMQRGETCELYHYSVSKRTHTLLRRANGGTCLFRIDERRYFKDYYGGGIAIGDVKDEKEYEKKELIYHKFIQLSPTRYFAFLKDFYLIDVSGEVPEFKRFTPTLAMNGGWVLEYGTKVDENTVAMMRNEDPSVYLMDIQRDVLTKVNPVPADLVPNHGPGGNYMAGGNGVLFFTTPYYHGSLLCFEPRDVKYTGRREEKGVRIGDIEFKKVRGRQLKEPRVEGEEEKTLFVYEVTNCQAYKPEYLSAVSAVVRLAEVPSELQKVIGGFLL